MNVVVTRILPGAAVDRVRAAGHDVWVYPEDHAIPRPLLMEQIQTAQGLLSLLTDRVDDVLLDNAPSLKVVANYAVGFDNIDVQACHSHGVVVTNTPDVLTEATADQAWALLMATARRVVEGHDMTRFGQFKGWKPGLLLGRSVFGATLGIMGAGRIGRAVARRTAGFSMRLLYTDPKTWEEGERDLGAERVPLDTLLRESDFVSLHVPLDRETHHLIRQETLEQMKPTAILINTSRGGLVHEPDLLAALDSGQLLGAGVDVFDPEPPSPNNPLLQHPKVTLAPHLGSATVQAREAMADLAAQNILAVLAGEEPLTPVHVR